MTCDRCHQQTHSVSGSYFNVQTICPDCEEKEKAHPQYEEARRIEGEHVMQGNYNFPGIGLPADLR